MGRRKKVIVVPASDFHEIRDYRNDYDHRSIWRDAQFEHPPASSPISNRQDQPHPRQNHLIPLHQYDQYHHHPPHTIITRTPVYEEISRPERQVTRVYHDDGYTTSTKSRTTTTRNYYPISQPRTHDLIHCVPVLRDVAIDGLCDSFNGLLRGPGAYQREIEYRGDGSSDNDANYIGSRERQRRGADRERDADKDRSRSRYRARSSTRERIHHSLPEHGARAGGGLGSLYHEHADRNRAREREQVRERQRQRDHPPRSIPERRTDTRHPPRPTTATNPELDRIHAHHRPADVLVSGGCNPRDWRHGASDIERREGGLCRDEFGIWRVCGDMDCDSDREVRRAGRGHGRSRGGRFGRERRAVGFEDEVGVDVDDNRHEHGDWDGDGWERERQRGVRRVAGRERGFVEEVEYSD